MDAGYICGDVLLATLLMLAAVAAAGLMASDVGTGSLSYLLVLPISRSRIWWGKALAGLALIGASAVGLFLPAGIAIPGVRESLQDVIYYLPDLLVGVVCAFAITLWCSTLFARPLTVLLAAPVLVLVLGAAIVSGTHAGPQPPAV